MLKTPSLPASLSAAVTAFVMAAISGSAQQSPAPPIPVPPVLQRYTR